MKGWMKGLLGLGLAVAAMQASAQNEQYVPVLS
jgi:hypothetical protein